MSEKVKISRKRAFELKFVKKPIMFVKNTSFGCVKILKKVKIVKILKKSLL